MKSLLTYFYTGLRKDKDKKDKDKKDKNKKDKDKKRSSQSLLKGQQVIFLANGTEKLKFHSTAGFYNEKGEGSSALSVGSKKCWSNVIATQCLPGKKQSTHTHKRCGGFVWNNIKDVSALLDALNMTKPLVVASSRFKNTYLEKSLQQAGISYELFSDFTPNPCYRDIAKGVHVFCKYGCDSFLSFGGGSAIDVAKGIKMFAHLCSDNISVQQNQEEEIRKIYECIQNNLALDEYGASSIPHVAVPTTAGTGSESTQVAVAYRDNCKKSIHHECLLPEAAILDASLLSTLPQCQRSATFLDALCQAIESHWSVGSTELSRTLSFEAIKTLNNCAETYLFARQKYQPDKDLVSANQSTENENKDREKDTGRGKDANKVQETSEVQETCKDEDIDIDEEVNKAEDISAFEAHIGSNLAGQAINITGTTAPHAMSYGLTVTFGIPHGHAVALCMPYVWEKLLSEGNTDTQERLLEIAHVLGVNKPCEGLDCFRQLFTKSKLEAQLSGTNEDAVQLAAAVDASRLGNFPVLLTREDLENIYMHIVSIS